MRVTIDNEDVERAKRLLTLQCPAGCGAVAKLRVVEKEGGVQLQARCRFCAGYESVYVTDGEITSAGLWMVIEAAAAVDEAMSTTGQRA